MKSTISHFITLTSQWLRGRFKSPASGLFTQPFIQTQIKASIKAPRHWPLCGEFTGTSEFPAQRASYAENVSIWWRHHVLGTVKLSSAAIPGNGFMPFMPGYKAPTSWKYVVNLTSIYMDPMFLHGIIYIIKRLTQTKCTWHQVNI